MPPLDYEPRLPIAHYAPEPSGRSHPLHPLAVVFIVLPNAVAGILMTGGGTLSLLTGPSWLGVLAAAGGVCCCGAVFGAILEEPPRPRTAVGLLFVLFVSFVCQILLIAFAQAAAKPPVAQGLMGIGDALGRGIRAGFITNTVSVSATFCATLCAVAAGMSVGPSRPHASCATPSAGSKP